MASHFKPNENKLKFPFHFGYIQSKGLRQGQRIFKTDFRHDSHGDDSHSESSSVLNNCDSTMVCLALFHISLVFLLLCLTIFEDQVYYVSKTSSWKEFRRSVVSKTNHSLVWIVRKADNANQRINHYPVDSVVCFVNTYPLDSDLSGGWHYPTFEQLISLISTSIVNLLLSE